MNFEKIQMNSLFYLYNQGDQKYDEFLSRHFLKVPIKWISVGSDAGEENIFWTSQLINFFAYIQTTVTPCSTWSWRRWRGWDRPWLQAVWTRADMPKQIFYSREQEGIYFINLMKDLKKIKKNSEEH